MEPIIENVNSTAQVLGYPVLVFVILVMAWACAMAVQGINKIIMSMQYDRKKRKDAERELDNITSSWLLDTPEEPTYQPGKHDTLDLSDIPDQLYDYQEDQRYESR